ncbi:MAG: hypothetical protein AAGF85_17755 [Bacteroidota bacterium]
MTLADLINNLLQGFRTRLKSPIFSTFLISLLLYNWRSILVILFSDKPIEESLEFVQVRYLDIWGIVVPFIIAITYLIGTDFIMMVVDRTVRNARNKRREYREDEEKNVARHKTELASFKYNEKEALAGAKTIEDYEAKIKSMQAQINQTQENESNLRLQNSVLSKQLNDISLNIQGNHDIQLTNKRLLLRLIRSYGPDLSEKGIELMFKLFEDNDTYERIPKGRFNKVFLEDLVDYDLLEAMDEEREFYQLTKKGYELKREFIELGLYT